MILKIKCCIVYIIILIYVIFIADIISIIVIINYFITGEQNISDQIPTDIKTRRTIENVYLQKRKRKELLKKLRMSKPKYSRSTKGKI